MIAKTKYITQREGIIFILSAPSGTGKTTLVKGLRSIYPDIRLSVSFTTRARRTGEIPGRDYYFVRSAKFAAMKAQGDFAEWAQVHEKLAFSIESSSVSSVSNVLTHRRIFAKVEATQRRRSFVASF